MKAFLMPVYGEAAKALEKGLNATPNPKPITKQDRERFNYYMRLITEEKNNVRNRSK